MLRSRRGTTIGTALLVASLLLMFGLTSATLSTSHLHMAGQQKNSQTARDLAESVISQAMARIIVNTSFGRGGAASLTMTFAGLAAADQGVIAFDSASASQMGIPLSVNNFGNESSVPGWNGTTVPGDTLDLVGVGRCGGVERRVEAVIFLPRFPYVVASSGPLDSTGGLYVAGVLDASALQNGVNNIPPSMIRPGHLASNATQGVSGAVALSLTGSGNRVSGDVQAVGNILIGPQTYVGGEVRPFSDAVTLPQVSVTSYDTAGKSGLVTLSGSSYSGDLTVSGYARHDGDYHVSGSLSLSGGVLYVNGSLTVDSGISGRGAVVVNGTTVVNGGGNLGTNNLAALLSQSDVTIQGTASQHAAFQGLVYTQGNLSTQNVDLCGVLVCNKTAGSQVNLQQTNLYELPQAASISFPVNVPAPAPSPPAYTTGYLPIIPLGNPGFTLQGTFQISQLSSIPHDQYYQYTGDPNQIPGYLTFTTYNASTGQTTTVGPFQTWADVSAYVVSQGGQPINAASISTYTNALTNEMIRLGSQLTPSPTASPSGSPTPSGTTEMWTLDLSQFLNVTDRIRVLLWRDI